MPRPRATVASRRTLAAVGVSAAITLTWAVCIASFDLWDRIAPLWPATLTMMFGSIVAGSTPQGGGVVAFPVFTKVLSMPAEVARSFALCIQAVGMTAASAWIIIQRRPVVWRAVGVMTAASVVGFLVVATVLTDASRPFRPTILPGPYVKVTFTIILIAMAFVVYRSERMRQGRPHVTLPAINGRMLATMLALGLLGGVASGLVGSGADVFLYLAIVLFFGVDPKVGVPTSVLCMAAISILGALWFGIVQGGFDIGLDATGAVVSVGGLPVTPGPTGALTWGDGPGAAARRFDLLGLWLAAVPVVCWGAPIGTWIAARMTTRRLVAFVALLSLAEVVSTAVFLKALRTDMVLLAYFVLGIVATVAVLRWISSRRSVLFGVAEPI